MRRSVRWLAVLVVGIVIVSGVVYALDYRGNYNLTVTADVVCDSLTADATVALVEWDCEPTSMVDFWDLLKGHGRTTPEGTRILWVTLNLSATESLTEYWVFQLLPGNSTEIALEFENIAPGSYTMTVELENRITLTTEFSNTYSVRVGP